ncbi:NUDIX hydrolase [Agromyces protaetiae]|uniref:NUDIX hydrolase n=1 Tax=Agromyces protaetiae TaxID=2509455 RepID=A0A4P6FEM9_9MICO|nr:NUDIX hydrolase [Agromyces protaetiae]QAY74276.1 NUDIX hydrolase [Agromyces protaetiae]
MAEAELADEPVALPLRSSERVFEGRVWDIRRETFDYDGVDVTRDFVDHTGAVGVLAIDDDDRVLVIKQYRHPIGYRDWEIPAGLLDVPGEDPLAGAKRELAEEADLEASEWAVLSDLWTSPGGSDESIRIYLARGLSATAEAFEREHEESDLELRWVPLDDLVDVVLARDVRNAPLVVAALAAQAARARGWSTLGAADAPWPGRSRPRGANR